MEHVLDKEARRGINVCPPGRVAIMSYARGISPWRAHMDTAQLFPNRVHMGDDAACMSVCITSTPKHQTRYPPHAMLQTMLRSGPAVNKLLPLSIAYHFWLDLYSTSADGPEHS